jgi:hypothetical protein
MNIADGLKGLRAMRALFLRITTTVALVCFFMDTVEAACGTRGGPGYRGPDGKCVSWAGIGRVCGNPPSLRCTAENTQPEAPDAAKRGNEIRKFMDDAHQRNQKQRSP